MNRRLIVPLLVALSACIISRGVQVASVERPAAAGDTVTVRSPVKVHLIDGSTALFRSGIQVSRDRAWGTGGMRYGLTLRDSSSVSVVSMDSVLGMESFRDHVNTGRTILYSVLATSAVIGAGVAIACAADPKCFGSCPTFYADSAGEHVLEAEGFSYSIAPLFEARDVDRLRFPAGAQGIVRLEVRNEAFETHFINHLELLEVRHGVDELALTDERNRPFVVAALAAPLGAISRTGEDIRGRLAVAEGDVYRTAATVLEKARANDADDWIDLVAPAPPAADSIAIVFRLRNSLLNTILLYDIMLGDPGARSLDWVGHELEQVGPAVELAQWYQRRMGMDVAVLDRGNWRWVAHLKDTGPVAWKDVAVVVPVVAADTVRIRLKFPADNWRLDRVAIAGRYRRLAGGAATHRLSAVRDARERLDTAAAASMAAADERYLEVASGQRFTAEFQTEPVASDSARTFFLGSQGYYTEWVRNGWLRAPRSDRTFTPSDDALVEALHRWRVTQDTLEARFMATRVPVR
jgi:hypothetical protein